MLDYWVKDKNFALCAIKHLQDLKWLQWLAIQDIQKGLASFLQLPFCLLPAACGFSLLSSFGAASETKEVLRNESVYSTSVSVFTFSELSSSVTLGWVKLQFFQSAYPRWKFLPTHHTYLLSALEKYLPIIWNNSFCYAVVIHTFTV